MEYIQVNNCKVNYECAGEGSAIILLHGWGQNIEMMKPIADHLKSNFKVYSLDFPGFGQSSEPLIPWGVSDYADMLREFIVKLDIERPIILGHSFGCRVAIHYANKYPVNRLLLTGAAGLKSKRGISYYTRTYTFKALKNLCKLPGFNQYKEALQNHFGSTDYKNTTGVMRETFVKVVNDDVKDLIPNIKVPVLLIFGENDDATPLWMAKYMEKHFPDAGLVVFEGAGHYAYLQQLSRFLKICDVFFVNESGEK